MSTQNAVHNNKYKKKPGYAHLVESGPDNLTWWMQQYFKYEVSTPPSSRKAQGKDIILFLVWMQKEEGSNSRVLWSPRLSRFFLEHLRTVIDEQTNRRRWGDNSIKRILAHLKTFANWVHKLQPFPLGNPMEKITATKISTGLEIERSLTRSERRRIPRSSVRCSQEKTFNRNICEPEFQKAHQLAFAPIKTTTWILGPINRGKFAGRGLGNKFFLT